MLHERERKRAFAAVEITGDASCMLVDCDIHIGPGNVLELAEHTDSATRDLLLHSGTEGLGLPDYPWYHPTGWVRKDAYDPHSADSRMHTIDLEKVRAQVLDPHDVTFGIATPDQVGGALCVLPNPILAARLARAHNDWVLEHYLQPESRLRGLIAISPQNPAEAAREIRRVGGRDEFVGIFLPGGARIPYGNPVHDPIWEAADEFALPDYPWYHPTGWVRKDAYDANSPDPAMHTIDLEKVRAQVLDAHDVTFAIATPDEVGGALCVMPNPVIAAKLAS
ncbi:MAG: uncharacterized protein QOC86_1469, partial [Gaiellales bacterium]|nr:uncharacterized protein [Gaiellales bacterium]